MLHFFTQFLQISLHRLWLKLCPNNLPHPTLTSIDQTYPISLKIVQNKKVKKNRKEQRSFNTEPRKRRIDETKKRVSLLRAAPPIRAERPWLRAACGRAASAWTRWGWCRGWRSADCSPSSWLSFSQGPSWPDATWRTSSIAASRRKSAASNSWTLPGSRTTRSRVRMRASPTIRIGEWTRGTGSPNHLRLDPRRHLCLGLMLLSRLIRPWMTWLISAARRSKR